MSGEQDDPSPDMRFYIASRIENIDNVRRLRDLLHDGGWAITYDWSAHGSVRGPGVTRTELDQVAYRELEGVRAADLVIVFLPGGRGTHVELGAALGLYKDVVLHSRDPEKDFATDERTSAFYHCQEILWRTDESIEELAEYLLKSFEP